jgi:diguanylate cyclase (GGDEF)-like protein/PAS domain S-box-containing protein
MQKMKDKQKIIAFSVVAAVTLWAANSAIYAFILHQGMFSDLVLFGGSWQELFSRLFLIAGILAYGIVITKMRDGSDRRKMHAELRANRERLEREVAERTDELRSVNELLHKEIQDRTRTEEELYRSECFLSTIFDSFHDPFNIVDCDYRIVKFNDAYSRIKNMPAKDLFGKKCHEALHERNSVCEDCIIAKTFQSKDPCAKEKRVTQANGTEMWIEIYTYPILDQQRNVTHVVEYTRDITDRKKSEEEKKQLIENLNYLSTTDSLTGLCNRRALTETLHYEIERAQRYDTDLSLILCDIDKFKPINDTYGHAAGDAALQAVSEALKTSLRKTDILGRYGGDEFMIILPETSLAGAKMLAEKVRLAVSEIALPVANNKRIGLSISLGVAGCCAPAESIDTLVRLADSALYTSKQGGRNKVSAMSR